MYETQTSAKGETNIAPIRPLYGVTINDTIKRGKKNEMQALLKEAKTTLKAQGDLAKAIDKLSVAIKKPKNGGHVMYGVPINDAIKRGNKAEMESLLAQAQQTQNDQGDLKKAIAGLESALKAKGKK